MRKKACFWQIWLHVIWFFFLVLGLRNFTLENSTVIPLPELTDDTIVGGENRYPCFLNVRVYSSPSFVRPADNIPVYALTERKGNLIGFSMSRTNSEGNACVMTLCYENALLHVETEKEKALVAPRGNQHLHFMVQYKVSFKRWEMNVSEITNYGSIFGAPGPVYTLTDRELCEMSGPSNFHFTYTFVGEEDMLETNTLAKENDPSTSWYPSFENNDACFVKVQIQVYQSGNLLIIYLSCKISYNFVIHSIFFKITDWYFLNEH